MSIHVDFSKDGSKGYCHRVTAREMERLSPYDGPRLLGFIDELETKKQNKMKVTVEEKEESEMPVFRVGNVVIRNHPAGSDACWPLLVTEVDWGNNSFKAAVINDLMDLTTTRRVNMSGYKQFHGTITLEV
jgi:hypothetical protein